MPDESPFGGKRGNRLISEMKSEGFRQIKMLRDVAMADGYPPGTVPVKDVAQQAQLIKAAQGNLGPQDRRRARQLGVQ